VARGVRLTPAAARRIDRSWLIVTAVLMAGAVAAWWLPAAWLDWQPERALAQPWRAWSAAWVHWSPLHLGTNLMAAAVVGVYGWSAQVPRAQALAWCAAWPLTHAALSIKPDLAHYGGLSGVLHAGVAIVCLWLLVRARGARRAVGAAVGLGLLIKLLSEQPWGPALQTSAEWDISIAPIAHASGALAGLLCGALALLLTRKRAA
jgi:rhomboid family GlyGly-CTERM serine protease